jgi:agmatinase
MALDAKSSAEPGLHNGQFLGLDHPLEKSKAVILPVPWDVTTSYRPGTVSGPAAVIEASYQIDLYSQDYDEFWNAEISTLPISKTWFRKSQLLRKKVEKYIRFLEKGGRLEKSKPMQALLKEVNANTEKLNAWVYQETKQQLNKERSVFVLGGDHSVPLGSIKAFAEKYSSLSVLHFDAHADLREAYEGFEDSHASIMNNVLKKTKIQKLVQVGIRDVSQLEVDLSKKESRVETFYDWDLKKRAYSGENWASICKDIVSKLTKDVYISFDIDGLDPKLCPNTGTPVPGGLEFREAAYLIQAVVECGRKIVGGDLVEVAPAPKGDNEWDGNVGARILVQLCVGHFRSL